VRVYRRDRYADAERHNRAVRLVNRCGEAAQIRRRLLVRLRVATRTYDLEFRTQGPDSSHRVLC
jgi:hypothetical protein